jgi:O-antigen/teichoic acid export membrane protein
MVDLTAQQRLQKVPLVVWQVLQMVLLGMTGIVFIPALARMVVPSLLAGVLVAQVFVYCLVLFTQYGFAWSGPAALAQTEGNDRAATRLWQLSVRAKLLLLCGPVLLVCGVGYVHWADATSYMWVYAALLFACALNSNWFLQARGDFISGVLWVLLGLLASGGLLAVLWRGLPQNQGLVGAVVVAILVLPQSCLGVGSWWRARAICMSDTLKSQAVPWQEAICPLYKHAPLVVGQLMLLASTTLGTMVVCALADAQTTAAYAATEKLFNLGATALVGVYSALYPKLAKIYNQNRPAYWAQTRSLLGLTFVVGSLLMGVLAWVGEPLLVLYLSAPLAECVVPVLLPFGFWLALSLGQHVVTGYLVLAGRNGQVLLLNGAVLGLTAVLGAGLANLDPINWVYGMIAGQLLAIGWLVCCYVTDKES